MKISVLTPSYNSGAWIERAIQSVLHQDYDNIEHIVVDGGSSDNTLDILKRYDHLKWMSEKDQGQSDGMNKAFQMSTGDIIVYLNADDYFNPNVFQTVIDYFTQDKYLNILVGNLYMTSPEKTDIRLVNSEYRFKKILLDFKYGFPYNPVSYFYKREVQEKLGPFPLENHYIMDVWFIINAFKNHKVVKTELVLGNYFDTGDNKSSQAQSTNLVRSFIREFIRREKQYHFYYYANFILFQITYFFKVELKNVIKYLIIKSLNPKKRIRLKDLKTNSFSVLLKNKGNLD
jgi:glycosyltransferase involved in cell wall biosynthesis